MKGALKIGIAVALILAVAGFLVVAADGARGRGRMTHCRNNLRKIGEMAHQKLESEIDNPVTGRAFWQEVRSEQFSKLDRKTGKDKWDIRFGGMNPFACPVLGTQPADLSIYADDYAGLERLMSNPSTIDYRGPRSPVSSSSGKPEVLGGDRPGNHPRGSGHVLLIDLSVREIRDALTVQLADEGSAQGLSD
jgi:hypothetical protein